MVDQVAAVVLGSAAFLAAGGAIAKSPPVRWLVRRNITGPLTEWNEQSTEKVVKRVTAPMSDRLDAIEAELRPNHGSSLRDVADRIESAVKEGTT